MIVEITCLVAQFTFIIAADDKKAPAELQGAWRLISVGADAGSNDLPEPRPALVIKGA
jgi:hypothetical protein